MTITARRAAHLLPTPAGDLEVHELGSGPATVVAVHGITSNGLAFLPLAQALDGVARVLAPDLRGRGGSAAVPSGPGLVDHASDVAAVAAGFRLDRPVLLGHSLGAFVAALAAVRHPESFGSLVLVDGGVAFPSPAPDASIDEQLLATIGPAMRRLTMRFPSEQSYLDFWREHPALGPLLDVPGVADHLLHDLVRDTDGLRSSCVADVIRLDGAAVLADPDVHAAAHTQALPTTLLRAGRGMLDQPGGLLPASAFPGAVTVPAANHYSIVLAGDGLAAVAASVRSHISGEVAPR
ncbi:alpha/beta fold hydrolase [Nakamurella sp. YIM 132087]|uniref:Alpha/beta fold hydrolase n=1 Tax=Nakamurella alba TaxID=2665158 RepID=A0A7K1FVZ0_9ACTN|nr:alpha/beta hydrolase [Nakamurella alba]MTD16974.1 alpha/beta fold hydrolase [Nakamurella alba]